MAGKKINTKSELSKTDMKIVIIIVIFLLAIIIGFIEFLYIYKPNAEKITETQQTLDGLQIRLDEAKKIPNQIAHYQREIDILEGKTVEHDIIVPVELITEENVDIFELDGWQ